jgi:hypothetical protein
MGAVLICGDRNWRGKAIIKKVLAVFDKGVTIIHGGAPGADSIADNVAHDLGLKVREFKAEWDRYGRGAGPKRNQRMLDEGKPDCVIAFHHNINESRGTRDMVIRALKSGIPPWWWNPNRASRYRGCDGAAEDCWG